MTRDNNYRDFYEEKYPDVREEQLKRIFPPNFRIKKKSDETKERERIERKVTSRSNRCCKCFIARPCGCDDTQYFG